MCFLCFFLFVCVCVFGGEVESLRAKVIWELSCRFGYALETSWASLVENEDGFYGRGMWGKKRRLGWMMGY